MRREKWFCLLALVGCTAFSAASHAQDPPASVAPSHEPATSRLNTWSAAFEFVPTTQSYFLGQAEQRRFVALGGEYARRLHRGRAVDVFYVIELRPMIFERDPVLAGYNSQSTGQPVLRFPDPQRVVYVNSSPAILLPQNVVVVPFYGRTWTYGASVSPIGTRVNFLPRRRWQPFVETSVGAHFTTRDVPVGGARSFNFTFEGGTGVEWYFHKTQSWRFEFLFRHISNAYTGANNPGIDAPTIRAVYSFGR